MLFHRDVSHVKELLYLINLVQEGFNIKVLAERKNFVLHLILIRTWVFSSLIMVRKRKSSSSIRIRIGHLPRALLIGRPSIVNLIFKVVFLIEGVVEFLLVGEIFVRKISRGCLGGGDGCHG